MYIYAIENILNGKVYIGKSERSGFKRFTEHFSLLRTNDHYNKHLQRSWNKYGESNFKIYKIEDSDAESINDLEKYYIKLSMSHNPDFGYNLTYGGEGTLYTEEMKLKISKRLKGVPKSEEHKRKMSETHLRLKVHLGVKQSEHTCKLKALRGREQVQSEQTKKKRALKQTGSGNHRWGKCGELSASWGKPNVNRKPVDCFYSNGVFFMSFDCIKDAANFLKVSSSSNISACLNGKQKTCNGYIFKKRETNGS